MNPGENLGGSCRRRFATARTAKNSALDAITVGKNRQDQVAITEGMMVKHKGVVVEEGHQDMVTEPAATHPPESGYWILDAGLVTA